MQFQQLLTRGAGAHAPCACVRPCSRLRQGKDRGAVARNVSESGFAQQLRSMIGLAAAEAVQCKERSEVHLQQAAAVVHPFRVATFNILADGLAQSGDFFKVPISCLMWEHRLPLIMQEIRAANADIICLQELNHFGESAP
eukprot:GHRQ01023503.1.p1 GENE.GHRQ01023503.1~~GHRQ01023503.1.p1  ORF type:complete len:141 (+),score=23.17 GHRQ01023503.1:276-698(+)